MLNLKNYHVPGVTNRKLSDRRVGPFMIEDMYGKQACKLALPKHWKIHPVISIADLEPLPDRGPVRSWQDASNVSMDPRQDFDDVILSLAWDCINAREWKNLIFQTISTNFSYTSRPLRQFIQTSLVRASRYPPSSSALSLLPSRLGYLEEERCRKRNEIRDREGEGRERKREEQVTFPPCLSTSIKGLFWSGFNLNFFIQTRSVWA